MKAKKIWIATHPENPHIQEVSLSEPTAPYCYLTYDSGLYAVPPTEQCEWVEYVCIPIEQE